MLGPYAYTPPVYWFTNENLGGAYGFNSETCPGANVPPIESIKKMIPEDNLWPVNDYWNFHCGKNVFSRLDRFCNAVERRYGKYSNLEDFLIKAQIMNYELMRPMFEAFQANKLNATGIIQWMLNSAWPEMYWQLYDSFLRQNGAYYGAKKANEPVHLLYNYGNNTIYKVNDTFEKIDDHRAVIQIFDIESKLLYKEKSGLSIDPESSKAFLKLPELENLSETYFLSLKLFNVEGNEISNNFYWLSTKKDVLNYDYEFEDWAFYTPSKEYADFRLLEQMSNIKLEIDPKMEILEDCLRVTVNIFNNSNSISFFNELLLIDKNFEILSPVIWSDNYISILPGERKSIEGLYQIKIENFEIPDLKIRGWNLQE